MKNKMSFLFKLVKAYYIAIVNTLMGDRTSVIIYNGYPAIIQKISKNEFFIDAFEDCFIANEMEV